MSNLPSNHARQRSSPAPLLPPGLPSPRPSGSPSLSGSFQSPQSGSGPTGEGLLTIVRAQIVFLLSTLTEENFAKNQAEIGSVRLCWLPHSHSDPQLNMSVNLSSWRLTVPKQIITLSDDLSLPPRLLLPLLRQTLQHQRRLSWPSDFCSPRPAGSPAIHCWPSVGGTLSPLDFTTSPVLRTPFVNSISLYT
jgi:hypothetical protein